MIHIAITYNKKEKSLKFFKIVKGTPELHSQEDNVVFDFFCQGVINIGQTVFSNSNKLVGKIAFVEVWNMALADKEIMKEMMKPDPKPTVSPN